VCHQVRESFTDQFSQSFKLSDICDKEFHKMAQTFGMTAEYEQHKGKIEKKTATTTRQPEEYKINNIEPEAKKL
jgi:hypothetical protein